MQSHLCKEYTVEPVTEDMGAERGSELTCAFSAPTEGETLTGNSIARRPSIVTATKLDLRKSNSCHNCEHRMSLANQALGFQYCHPEKLRILM